MNERAERITCAEAVLRTMRDLGYEKFFNIPGRGIYPLLEKLPSVEGLDHVTGLHEFPLSAIADGYTRASGKPAFLNLYMSTGVLNAASSIFLAQRDRIPMVVTATQAESWAVGADHRAEISDIVEAMRPVTKWAWMPTSPQRVLEALQRAHAIATTPPMGPTFVPIPVDFWNELVDYAPPPRRDDLAISITASSPAIERIAELFARAERPSVVIGYEAIASGATAPLVELASDLGVAVIAEPEPPMLPTSVAHELFAGSVAEAVGVIEETDLVLHVGVNTYEACHRQIFDAGRAKQHLWIGTSDRELDKVVLSDVALVAPIGPAVEALVAAVRSHAAPATVAERHHRVVELIAEERSPIFAEREHSWDGHPMSVARVCHELRNLLPPETVLLDHSTTAVRQVREHFVVPSGPQYVSASGSCQGWGIGAAVGVQLGTPSAPVVGIVGDGGLMFGIQALWTAAAYDVPLLAVALNNGGWSSMLTSLGKNAPSVVAAGSDLHFGWSVDCAQIAEAMGVAAETVSTPDELVAAVSRHLPLTKPLLLNVNVRREPKTSPSPFVGY